MLINTKKNKQSNQWWGLISKYCYLLHFIHKAASAMCLETKPVSLFNSKSTKLQWACLCGTSLFMFAEVKWLSLALWADGLGSPILLRTIFVTNAISVISFLVIINFFNEVFIKKFLKAVTDLSESYLQNLLHLKTMANIFASIYKPHFYHILWFRFLFLLSSPSKC